MPPRTRKKADTDAPAAARERISRSGLNGTMTRLAHARVIRSLIRESNVLYHRRVHWRMLFLVGLLAVSGPDAAGAATFTVDSYGSFPDAAPGDGICQTAYFLPECTPLAAVEEANAPQSRCRRRDCLRLSRRGEGGAGDGRWCGLRRGRPATPDRERVRIDGNEAERWDYEREERERARAEFCADAAPTARCSGAGRVGETSYDPGRRTPSRQVADMCASEATRSWRELTVAARSKAGESASASASVLRRPVPSAARRTSCTAHYAHQVRRCR
jgi:hypothetical protein